MADGNQSSLSVADQQRLASVTNSYRLALEKNVATDLKSFVEQSEFPLFDQLVQSLVRIDIEHRVKRDLPVTGSDYHWLDEATGDLAEGLISEARDRNVTVSFNEPRESTDFEAGFNAASLSMSLSGAQPSKPSVDFSSIKELGDYQIVRELGRGGMGVVFEAVHKTLGNSVAVKLLPQVDGTTLHKFKREFRSLTETNHPNLIGLHSLEFDQGIWFFTMDLVHKAVDFGRYVRPKGKLDQRRLRLALEQLVAGVSALHSRQIIHRDLKPGNVLVDADGKLSILDFGLVAELESRNASLTQNRISGTPGYMSPEQARGDKPTPQSDWYAVGVMLYEALSGRRPFSGQPLQVLLEKTRSPAPELQCGGPQDLCEFCMQMLETDSKDRPAAKAILSFVALDDSGSTAEIRQAQSSGDAANRTVLIGREEQLQEMKTAFAEFESSQESMSVFVSGLSGEGKTVLAEQFLETYINDDNYAFISGRCYDRESVPFKALDSLIDGLCGYLRKLDEREAALLMPREIGLLARLFPVLNRVNVVASMPTPRIGDVDDRQIQARAFESLRELLTRLSDGKPVIAFVDDLQWGDAESAEALFKALSPPNSPLLFFVGTYRSDEAKDSEFLKKWDQLLEQSQAKFNQRSVHVHPLSSSQCVDLIIENLGKDTPEIRKQAEELAEQTGGNPFLVSELLESIGAEDDANEPRALAQLIDSKLDALDSEATRMLNAVAVSGQALPLIELADAVGSDSFNVGVLTAMRNQRLVRMLGSDHDQRIDTYHDRIRETVLQNIAGPTKRECHLNLAKAIERSVGSSGSEVINSQSDAQLSRVYDLAYHYDAAGESAQTLKYSVLAAEQAERQFSSKVASEQFARAARHAGGADEALKFRIFLGWGKASRLTGQYSDAIESLDRAYELASTQLEKAQVDGLRAEITHKQGQMGESLKLYSQALRQLGVYVPRTRVGFTFALAYQVMVQVAHTCLPKFIYQRNREATPEESLAMELANRNSIVSYFNDGIRMMWTHLRGLNLAETRKPGRMLSYAYGLHPAPLMSLRIEKRGQRYSAIGTKLAEEYGDQMLIGHCYAMIGLAEYSNGHYERSIKSNGIALDRLEKTGDYYLRMQTDFTISMSILRAGKTEDIARRVASGFNREINFGECSLAGCYLYLGSIVTDGKLPIKERLKRISVDESDNMVRSFISIAEGLGHLNQERYEEAYKEFNNAWSLVFRQLTLFAPTFCSLNWTTTALRKWAASLGAGEEKLKKSLLKKASRKSRLALLMSRIYFAERTHSLREAGLVHELKNEPAKAMRRLNQSLELSEKLGDQWNRAVALKEIGRIEKQQGLSGADEKIAKANAFLEGLDRAGERIDALMES